MIYIRREGIDLIRQGFNFYPSWNSSIGCQMLFGRLRVEVRYSKVTKKLRIGAWIKQSVAPVEESAVYIPGYTDALKKLYEANNEGKKYENWVRTKDIELDKEKQPIASKSERYRSTAWEK